MTLHSRTIALLDANVLYPAPLRDFLLRLAEVGLYTPKWSAQIHEEWIRNLLQNRPDLKKSALQKTRAAMEAAFPDALIKGYEKRINRLRLPDADDRHVLAAAIHGKTDLIVTFNTKDFPAEIVTPYRLSVQHPDEFTAALVAANRDGCQQALSNQVNSLKHQPMTKAEVLAILERCGLVQTVALLKE